MASNVKSYRVTVNRLPTPLMVSERDAFAAAWSVAIHCQPEDVIHVYEGNDLEGEWIVCIERNGRQWLHGMGVAPWDRQVRE